MREFFSTKVQSAIKQHPSFSTPDNIFVAIFFLVETDNTFEEKVSLRCTQKEREREREGKGESRA